MWFLIIYDLANLSDKLAAIGLFGFQLRLDTRLLFQLLAVRAGRISNAFGFLGKVSF